MSKLKTLFDSSKLKVTGTDLKSSDLKSTLNNSSNISDKTVRDEKSDDKKDAFYHALINQTKSFVESVCPKGDRDPSHGMEHFEQVVNNVIEIANGEKCKNIRIRNLAIVCAWLHDVADHKYDKNGRLKMLVHSFLNSLLSNEDLELVEMCIDRGSYSKQVKQENAGTLQKWFDELGKDGKIVRDYLSDADKLEAIDKIGLTRMIEYIVHSYFEEHKKKIDLPTLKKKVEDHAKEKLLRLKDNYIYTKTGKLLAEPKHERFVKAMDVFLKMTEKEFKMLFPEGIKASSPEEQKKQNELKSALGNYVINGVAGIYMAYYQAVNDPNLKDKIKHHTSEMNWYGYLSFLNQSWHDYGKKKNDIMSRAVTEVLNKKCIIGAVCAFQWFSNLGELVIKKVTKEHVLAYISKPTKETAYTEIITIITNIFDAIIQTMPPIKCEEEVDACRATYTGQDLFKINFAPKKDKETTTDSKNLPVKTDSAVVENPKDSKKKETNIKKEKTKK